MRQVKVHNEPYWFDNQMINGAEDHYKAKYMGSWCVKDKKGNWTDSPVEVFYNPEPDISLGHSNYLGLYTSNNNVFVCDAASAFEASIYGLTYGNEVYVSKYRHDFVSTPDGSFIDGGRDYVKTNKALDVIALEVIEGKFYIKEIS